MPLGRKFNSVNFIATVGKIHLRIRQLELTCSLRCIFGWWSAARRKCVAQETDKRGQKGGQLVNNIIIETG